VIFIFISVVLILREIRGWCTVDTVQVNQRNPK
jgi:hypothetical protein